MNLAAAAKLQELHEDRRGAVMMIGLGMSCFLIGALWFLIGIGDAIVFRDTMQEASDSAAFTSASLHAKGMNFISALNLILLVAIAAYILMGILHDALFFVCLAAGWWTAGTACVPWLRYRPFWTKYAKVMKIGADILHYTELVAAYGYPILATYKGWSVGRDYGHFSGPTKRDLWVVPITTSIIPGFAINGPLNKAIQAMSPEAMKNDPNAFIKYKGNGGGPTLCKDGQYSNSSGSGTCSGHGGVAAVQVPPPQVGTGQNVDTYTSPAKKKGLPVEGKKWEEVCGKFGKLGVDAILGLVAGIPSSVSNLIRGVVEKGIKLRYCNPLGNDATGQEMTKNYGDAQEKIDKYNDDQKGKKNGGSPISESIGGTQSGGGAMSTDGNILGKMGIKIEIGSKGGGIDPGFDAWWGKEGPLLPWSGAGNGSAWQQIWAVNIMPDFKDDSQHRVSIAQRKFGVQEDAKAFLFVSQAEFYFDCKDDWLTPKCNKDDNAGYALRWRARLHRVQFPGIASMLSSFGLSFLENMKGYKDLKTNITKTITDKLGGSGSIAGSTIIGVVVAQVVKKVEGQVKGVVNGGAANVDETLNGLFTDGFGVYH
jgi:hypothetical protein